jgi:hypothetical protein
MTSMTSWKRNGSPTASASDATDKDIYGRDSPNFEKNLSSIAQAARPDNSVTSPEVKWWTTGSSSLAKWTCMACTYENWPKANKCTLCYTSKGSSGTVTPEVISNRTNSTSPVASENFIKPDRKVITPSNQSSRQPLTRNSTAIHKNTSNSSPDTRTVQTDDDVNQDDEAKNGQDGPRRQSM